MAIIKDVKFATETVFVVYETLKGSHGKSILLAFAVENKENADTLKSKLEAFKKNFEHKQIIHSGTNKLLMMLQGEMNNFNKKFSILVAIREGAQLKIAQAGELRLLENENPVIFPSESNEPSLSRIKTSEIVDLQFHPCSICLDSGSPSLALGIVNLKAPTSHQAVVPPTELWGGGSGASFSEAS